MKFIKFTENNEWEGESWYFWLQKNGNEKELQELADYISQVDADGEKYELETEEIDESEVDILVKHTNSGYIKYWNKCKGNFTAPRLKNDNDEDPLYKGGIASFFI